MYVKKCHTPPTKRANWFLSSYEPSRWVGEASWWNAMPFFSYFVASETHPSPEISHFFTKPTWTTGCFYLVCWSLQVSDVNKGIDSFHGSTNPCHDLKRHHLRNTCVWNDIRTVCADTDMSMFGCTCTCWYRSEGPELAYISWWFIPITLEQLHVLLSLALLKVWSFYIPLPLASSRWENCWLIDSMVFLSPLAWAIRCEWVPFSLWSLVWLLLSWLAFSQLVHMVQYYSSGTISSL